MGPGGETGSCIAYPCKSPGYLSPRAVVVTTSARLPVSFVNGDVSGLAPSASARIVVASRLGLTEACGLPVSCEWKNLSLRLEGKSGVSYADSKVSCIDIELTAPCGAQVNTVRLGVSVLYMRLVTHAAAVDGVACWRSASVLQRRSWLTGLLLRGIGHHKSQYCYWLVW